MRKTRVYSPVEPIEMQARVNWREIWKRQFALERAPGQVRFDVLFGIVLPILCLIFDPIVFRNISGYGVPLLSLELQLPAYLAMTIGMAALALWLFIEKHNIHLPPQISACLMGILLLGMMYSGVLGLRILPYSILGIALLGMGLLGLTPFFTAFVYFRNGTRVRNSIGDQLSQKLIPFFLIGVFLASGLPVIVKQRLTELRLQSIERIAYGDPLEAESAAQTLKAMFWCTQICYSGLVRAYQSSELDPARQSLIAHYYEEITGKPIDNKLGQLSD